MTAPREQHTPRPWTIQRLTDCHHGYDGWETFAIRSPENVCLATVGDVDRWTQPNNAANAALIASAPALLAERDALRAANNDLRAVVEDLLGLMDDGTIVRDVSHDHEPGWAIKQLPLVRTLAAARAALAQGGGRK